MILCSAERFYCAFEYRELGVNYGPIKAEHKNEIREIISILFLDNAFLVGCIKEFIFKFYPYIDPRKRLIISSLDYDKCIKHICIEYDANKLVKIRCYFLEYKKAKEFSKKLESEKFELIRDFLSPLWKYLNITPHQELPNVYLKDNF
jgi:hypothetical protein